MRAPRTRRRKAELVEVASSRRSMVRTVCAELRKQGSGARGGKDESAHVGRMHLVFPDSSRIWILLALRRQYMKTHRKDEDKDKVEVGLAWKRRFYSEIHRNKGTESLAK